VIFRGYIAKPFDKRRLQGQRDQPHQHGQNKDGAQFGLLAEEEHATDGRSDSRARRAQSRLSQHRQVPSIMRKGDALREHIHE